MNWLQFLAKKLASTDQVMVFTRDAPGEMETFDVRSTLITIRRSRNANSGPATSRYKSYLSFYISVVRQLARFKPDIVLYYESLSAFPAMYYKYFSKHDIRLLVHYHEYTSPAEYRSGMRINYRSHFFEQRLYRLYSGISHTNEARLKLFSRDNFKFHLPRQTIWPNYPPASWTRTDAEYVHGNPLRFVYVGALSMETMFVQAFAEWIISGHGRATWDIYSGNCTAETRQYLEEADSEIIRLHNSVPYHALPAILGNFDIGVILYKGHIPNYVHNAPNKLFEYWSCGLDVWFPKQMTGAFPYVTEGSYPRIVALNFEAPDKSWTAASDRTGLFYQPSPYSNEYAAEEFFNWMTQI